METAYYVYYLRSPPMYIYKNYPPCLENKNKTTCLKQSVRQMVNDRYRKCYVDGVSEELLHFHG
jgi:hypothetical protein